VSTVQGTRIASIVSYVTVYVRVYHSPEAEYETQRFSTLSVDIDEHGMVTLRGNYRFNDPRDRKRHQRDMDMLFLVADEGLIESRRTGEESDYFLTPEGREWFAPQLRSLGGEQWREWSA
jgi:hypothetical protein